jgi:hypothetical protein
MSISKNVLFLTILLPLFINAQTQIGLMGGTNQANVIARDLYYPSASKTAFQAGLFIKKVKRNQFNIGAEINYRRKTSTMAVYTSTGLAHPGEVMGEFKLDYVSLALLPEFRAGDKLEWFINAGPYFGGLVYRGNPNGIFPWYDWGLAGTTGITYRFKNDLVVGLNARAFLSYIGESFQSRDFGCFLTLSKYFDQPLFKESSFFGRMSKHLSH